MSRGQTEEWVHITVSGEEIVCTPGHPFYLPDKGWVTADELLIGDRLVTLDGEFVAIEHIVRERLDTPETTYNFEVEGFHTYYVSNAELLVHNKCEKTQTSPGKMQKQVERGQAPRSVDSVHKPHTYPKAKAHVHFKDGTSLNSLNIDGTIHDKNNGLHILTNAERAWLIKNGWKGN